MLVEAHGPERHNLPVRISICLCQFQKFLCRYTGHFLCILKRILGNELLIFFKVDLGNLAGTSVFSTCLTLVIWTQTVTDIGSCLGDVDVLVHEVPVHRIILDDVVRDKVEDHQIGLWCEHHAIVSKLEATMLESGKNMHFTARLCQACVCQA